MHRRWSGNNATGVALLITPTVRPSSDLRRKFSIAEASPSPPALRWLRVKGWFRGTVYAFRHFPIPPSPHSLGLRWFNYRLRVRKAKRERTGTPINLDGCASRREWWGCSCERAAQQFGEIDVYEFSRSLLINSSCRISLRDGRARSPDKLHSR